MVEGRLFNFKTKLCILYQRGRCSRQSCSFAHGETELRRFSGSFPGRRDSGGNDLRDRLDRRSSPRRRYSPERDARGRHIFREYSSSGSIERENKRRKKQHVDGQSDFSGSLRISNEAEDEAKDANIKINSKGVLEDELKLLQSEINVVDHRRSQLQLHLEEKFQEAESLSSKIKELEVQLYQEKEDCKRISSKVKKFVKEHSRHSKIQDQLKRSQVRLNKLGEQLTLDIYGIDANEEDSSINIVSDGETTGFPVTSHNEWLNEASPSKKRRDAIRDFSNEPKQSAYYTRGHPTISSRPKMLSRWNMNPGPSNFDKDNEAVNNGIGYSMNLAKEGKHDSRKTTYFDILSEDKVKSLEPRPVAPSTRMAARADDTEGVEIELDDKIEMGENASARIEEQAPYESGTFSLPLPPPPPVPNKNYSQYEGDDEIVDVQELN